MSLQKQKAILALADGKVFHGYSLGAPVESSGEVVFNTSLTGYQEIISDPSYCNQMIAFTYPHIGNVGTNEDDQESRGVFCSAVIMREYNDSWSNYRGRESLDSYLKRYNVPGIFGLDTRALVAHIRDQGAQMAVISAEDGIQADTLVDKAKALPTMEGLDLASEVSVSEGYDWSTGTWKLSGNCHGRQSSDESMRPLVVVIDCGVKFNILRLLYDTGFRVKVVPANTSAAQIKALSPDALFLSNGPGDPAAVTTVIATVRELLGQYPLFGICLGHQILGLALDAPTKKLKFGHHGGNHPVRYNKTGKVEITSQNHGFATDEAHVPAGLEVSHVNLNDGTIEGFEAPAVNAFSVQYHPEAAPGPHDAEYLFKKFRSLLN
ncbi:MAG: glutamine-hydrolyzing carbamoyl-phosphate synthase small subunit [bacterium]|nr:glutamine-hydrolyzing carbamoyl-phosphate synthase small subunit [bacterium]